ncbi:phytoene/squalene synthase family protein [Halocatena marina]|uniref:Phytoene/squalene synthase family protein n=1 Tax=Halocatena marina TaxID=2934937 RepID=A0ABD5YLY7_9EURY|nr:phytoene/squalene synthase family protein [Halocatena marina]
MVDTTQLRQSKTIQQRTGATFHVATRLFPQRVRHATYVLYAFFRIADEIVDDPDGDPPARQRAQLERLRTAALGERESDRSVVAAFSELREEYDIASEDVNAFIDAMATDITKQRYETYADLNAYMDGSAAAVGRMMTAVMDPDDFEQAIPHATALGEAFQLTNFLRDVREDVRQYDRIYLPQATLETHGVSNEQIESLRMDERFAAVMQTELSRAESLYEDGTSGIKYLPHDCQFAVLLAAVLYADYHRLIRAYDYDVLSRTPQLSRRRTASLCARTGWHWLRTSDPKSVFDAVSTPHPSNRYSVGRQLPSR